MHKVPAPSYHVEQPHKGLPRSHAPPPSSQSDIPDHLVETFDFYTQADGRPGARRHNARDADIHFVFPDSPNLPNPTNQPSASASSSAQRGDGQQPVAGGERRAEQVEGNRSEKSKVRTISLGTCEQYDLRW